MQKMQDAIIRPQSQTDMRRGIKMTSIARDNADDVAALKLELDPGHVVLWYLKKRPRRHAGLHLGKRAEQRTVCRQITIMPPADRHFPRRVRNTYAAEVAGEVFDQAALLVIVQPVLEIMQPGKIFPCANAAAVAIRLDVMQQTFRSPVFFRLVQHSRKRERDFEKRPAIHSLEIGRGRFDVIVDLEGEMLVAGANERTSDRGGALADRK